MSTTDGRTTLEKLLELKDVANNGGVALDLTYRRYVENNRKLFLEGEKLRERENLLKEKVDAEVVKELVKAGEMLQDVRAIEDFEKRERKEKKLKEKELKKIKKLKKKLKKKEKKMKKSLEKNELKEKVASELKNKFLLGGDILPTESIEDLVKDGFIKVLSTTSKKESEGQRREDVNEDDSYSNSLSYSSSEDSPRRARSKSRDRERRSRNRSHSPRRTRSRSRSLSRSSSPYQTRSRSHSPSRRPKSPSRARSYSPDRRRRSCSPTRESRKRTRSRSRSRERDYKRVKLELVENETKPSENPVETVIESPEELELRSKLLLALLMKQKSQAEASQPSDPST